MCFHNIKSNIFIFLIWEYGSSVKLGYLTLRNNHIIICFEVFYLFYCVVILVWRGEREREKCRMLGKQNIIRHSRESHTLTHSLWRKSNFCLKRRWPFRDFHNPRFFPNVGKMSAVRVLQSWPDFLCIAEAFPSQECIRSECFFGAVYTRSSVLKTSRLDIEVWYKKQIFFVSTSDCIV